MCSPDSTCWTVIEEAAAGSTEARDDFARRYSPVILTYLRNRWKGSSYLQELEDAVQQVFVELFREGGVLDKVDPQRPGGFRAFLYGVVRNVALRTETRLAKSREKPSPAGFDADEIERRESTLSEVFDRAWARAILREAAQKQETRAESAGEPARRRVELLRLRFYEGLPIREIASRWQMESKVLYREYAQARKEFRSVLLETVAFYHPGSAVDIEEESARLLELLS